MKTRVLFLLFGLVLINSMRAQAPVLNPITGPANFCYVAGGASFTTSASNSPQSYSWTILPTTGVSISNGNAVAAISFSNANGTYTISCTATNASGASNTQTFVVNVFEKPNVSFSGNTVFCQGSSTNLSASPTIIQASSTINQGSSTLYYTWSPGTGLNTTTGPNVVANPTITTTYTVSVMNGPCTNTAPITLSVNPLPTVAVTSGTICRYNSFVIQATGALNYNYSSGTNTVSPLVTTVYSVTGYDANGCGSSQATSTVVVNQPPVISIASNSTQICVGQGFVLVASGGVSYTWSPMNSYLPTNVYTVAPPIPCVMNITVTGFNSFGCYSTAQFTGTVSICTGIATHDDVLDNISVYPNPANNFVTIDLGGATPQGLSLQITNALGQLLVNEKINAQQSIYDVTALPAGVYLLQLNQGGAVKTLKLVKD